MRSESAPVADDTPHAARELRLAGLLLAALLLTLHSLYFNFVTDDAFISFVYSKNLVQHGQLVFTLGERVEGYTNFLWTLLIAGGLWLGIPAELSSRVLGTLLGIGGLVVVTYLFAFLRARTAPLLRAQTRFDSLVALCVAGIPGYACWSSGGLETQLFTCLLTVGCGLAFAAQSLRPPHATRCLVAAAVALGLSALTRPEGYLFFGLVALHRLGSRALSSPRAWRHLLPTRQDLAALAIFLGLCVPHLLFRRSYYGEWVPNTFFVKASGGPAAWQQGGYYLFAFARDLKLFVLPLICLAAWLTRIGPRPAAPAPAWPASSILIDDPAQRLARFVIFVWFLTVVFFLYVAKVGGDFMGLYRFVLPIVPLHVAAAAAGFAHLSARWAKPMTAGVLVLLAGLHAANTVRVDRHALHFIGADRGIDTPGYLRHYAADRTAIGKWLGAHVASDDYQVVGGAGAQVYYAGIRALDSFGLADAYVAKQTPALSVRPGHQKFAPLDYVLSRKPTILTYNVYRIAAAPYQPEPGEAAMWQARGFHYVSVQIPGLSQPWYSFLKRIDRSVGPLPPQRDVSSP